jgi:hypothetical protein
MPSRTKVSSSMMAMEGRCFKSGIPSAGELIEIRGSRFHCTIVKSTNQIRADRPITYTLVSAGTPKAAELLSLSLIRTRSASDAACIFRITLPR